MSLLEIDHVSKRFGGLRAINNVAFAIEENEIAFIVGPNGAGKTTLFNLITGVFHPDEGNIRFQGHDISHITPNHAARLGIGRTFQIVKPLRNLTVLENVMLGAFLHTSSPSKAAEQAREILEVSADGKGHALNRQRIAAAHAEAAGDRARSGHQAALDPAR